MKMAWSTAFHRYGPLLLEYKVYQSADPGQCFLFLHGYGQDFHCYNPLYKSLAEQNATFISIHLPFHGESRMEAELLNPTVWIESVRLILEKEGCSRVHGIAFSMGAKFLLVAAQNLPQVFSQITLLAPDGLVKNPWYHFATSSGFGRVCLRTGLFLFPGLKFFFRCLVYLKWVRPGMMRFALSELRDRQGREKLLSVWLGFREIWPAMQLLRSVLLAHAIPMQVFLGRYDSILPLYRYKKLMKREEWIKWYVLETGHAGLVEKYASGF